MMQQTKDKVAVITGASRGLGRGLAETFLERGLAVGLCARSRPEVEHERALCASVDVTDADAVRQFANAVTERFGRIDLWINNAGVLEPIGPVRAAASSDFGQHFEVNVLGVLHGSQAFIETVRAGDGPEQGQAVLINVSSGAARSPYEGWGAYCASKAAVDRLTEVVALEERQWIRAHSVAPGVIDTDMQATIRSKTEAEFPMVERFREMKEAEAFSTPAEVADGFLRIAFDGPPPDAVCMDLRDLE